MKINLLIDTSFFFHRSLSATDYTNYLQNNNEKVLDTQKTKAIFVRKVCMDLAYQIKKFEGLNISRIILCNDNKNVWRKDYYKLYKAHREKDDKVNWDSFYSLQKMIISKLQEKNCIVTSIEGLEGDDIIFLYTLLFKQNDNKNIIISSDKDLRQLVNHNTIVNNIITNKYYTNSEFVLGSTENKNIDILNLDGNEFLMSKSVSNLKNLLKDSVIIKGNDVVVEKIISGDKGDNVPQLIKGFGGKKVEGILNNYNIEFNEDYIKGLLDENNFMDFFDCMKKEMKKLEYDKVIHEDTIRNINLVWLNKDIIPKNLINDFKDFVSNNKNVLNKKAILYELTDMKDILKDTEYITSSDIENDDRIFDFSVINRLEEELEVEKNKAW